MRILAISGSLRQGSSNVMVLRAAAELAPEGLEVDLYDGLAALPHFNPDLDDEAHPLDPVGDWRERIRRADAVMICSPEYAHGVPGSLKNALDWVVGSGELVDKPLALVNASPRATHAQAALREILATMAARLVPEASIAVPILGSKLDQAGIVASPELSRTLRSALEALAAAAADGPVDPGP